MQILHLTTSFPANKNDAAGAFIHRLTNALEKRGVECHVLTPATTYPTRWPKQRNIYRFRYAPWRMQLLAQQPGGILVALKKNRLNFFLLPFFFISMTLTLCTRARYCDLIHAHWSICGIIAVISQIIHRKPVIITIHGSDQHTSNTNLIYSIFHRLAIQGAASTICVSRDIESDLIAQYPARSSQICFIANGVADVFFTIAPLPFKKREPLLLLTIGSLIPLKGIDTIIQSLSSLPSAIPWRLSIVGEGVERQKLQELTKKNNLAERITFAGTVAPESIPHIMSKHHLLILASHREGRPSVILEAMAASMAIVATNINGTRELVKNGDTGWLFFPGNINALASIIKSIACGERDILQAGIKGRNWMEAEKLTWSATADQHQKLYTKTIDPRK